MKPSVAIDHVLIAIPAGGELEARALYGTLIGLAEIAKPDALARWMLVQVGAHQLQLGIDPDFCAARKAHVAIATDDIPALRERLLVAAVAVTDNMSMNRRRRFFAAYPFGNRIEFLESGA